MKRNLYGSPTQVNAFFHDFFVQGCRNWEERMTFVLLWEQAAAHIRENHFHAWPRFANYEATAKAFLKGV